MEKENIIIYNTSDGKVSVALYAREGNVWMNQSQLAELFDTSVPNISIHISNILKEKELHANSVIKEYLSTASDGKQYSNEQQILHHAGSISNAQMEEKVQEVYETFDKNRKAYEAKQADLQDLEDLNKKVSSKRKDP